MLFDQSSEFVSAEKFRLVYSPQSDDGLPLAQEEVLIRILPEGDFQKLWRAKVNGEWVSLNTKTDWKTKSDSLGQVIVEFRATDIMWAPPVIFTHDTETNTVYPVDEVCTFFKEIQGVELKSLKNQLTRENIFPDNLNGLDLENVASAIRCLFASYTPKSQTWKSRYAEAGHGLPPIHTSGVFGFRKNGLGGMFDFLPDTEILNSLTEFVPIADLVSDVVSATAEPVTFAIKNVGGVVQIGFEYLSEGTHYILNSVFESDLTAGLLESAKALFDLVGEHLGLPDFFESAIRALLNLFFDFDRIIKNRDAIRNRINLALEKLPEKAKELFPSGIKDWISDKSQAFKDAISFMANEPTMKQTFGEFQEGGKSILSTLDPARFMSLDGKNVFDQISWLPDLVQQYLPQATFIPEPPMPTEAEKEKFLRILNNFHNSEKVEGCSDAIAQAMQGTKLLSVSPVELFSRLQELFDNLMEGDLLSDFYELLIGGLDRSKEIKEWLNKGVELPYLAKLLTSKIPFIKNHDLGEASPVNLASLSVAFALSAAGIDLDPEPPTMDSLTLEDEQTEKKAIIACLSGYAIFNVISEGATGDTDGAKALGFFAGLGADLCLFYPAFFSISKPYNKNGEATVLFEVAWLLDWLSVFADLFGMIIERLVPKALTTRLKIIVMCLLSTAALICYSVGYHKLTDEQRKEVLASLVAFIGISGTNIVRPAGLIPAVKKSKYYLAVQAALGGVGAAATGIAYGISAERNSLS